MVNDVSRQRALAEIRKRKAKLDDVERFLADADDEALDLVRMALSNGTPSETSKGATGAEPEPPSGRTGDSGEERYTIPRGALDAAVRNAVQRVRTKITVHTVKKILDSEGFQFGPGDPIRAIGTVLRKMRKRGGELIEMKAASGRSPAEYEVPS